MTECKYYATELLKRFQDYAGRIGHYCDACDIKACHHHKNNMKVEKLALLKMENAA